MESNLIKTEMIVMEKKMKNEKRAGGNGKKPVEKIDRVIHEPARLMIMAQLFVVEGADFSSEEIVYERYRRGYPAEWGDQAAEGATTRRPGPPSAWPPCA